MKSFKSTVSMTPQRIQGFGQVDPFILNFQPGNVPHKIGEIQELRLNRQTYKGTQYPQYRRVCDPCEGRQPTAGSTRPAVETIPPRPVTFTT